MITKITHVKEARTLPAGTVIGDLHGGLTFTDAIAAALENRSSGGWREVKALSGDIWTVICVDR